MHCVEETVDPGRERQNDGTEMVDREVPEVPGIFLEADSMSLSEESSQVRSILATRHPADLQESLAAAREKVRSIDVLTVGLNLEKIGP